MFRKLDLEFGLLCFFTLASAVFWVISLGYPPDAALFPRIITFVTLAFSVYFLIGKLRREKENRSSVKGEGLPWYFSAASMLAFLGLIYLAGFIVAMFLYLEATIFWLGYKKPVQATVISVLTTAILASAMKYFFAIPIPMGLLFG